MELSRRRHVITASGFIALNFSAVLRISSGSLKKIECEQTKNFSVSVGRMYCSLLAWGLAFPGFPRRIKVREIFIQILTYPTYAIQNLLSVRYST